MQRLVYLAVVALLGGVAVAGCGRAEPDVAAYVGNQRFTVQQVESLAKEVGDRLGTYGDAQQTVVSWLVISTVGQQMAQQQNLRLEPPGNVDEFAAQAGLQPGSPVAKLYLETSAVMQAIAQTVTPVEPTEADQREVHSSLTVDGQRITNPFEDVRGRLTKETIGVPLAIRKALADEVAKSDVTVNPRYAPLVFPIQVTVSNAMGSASVPLGAGSVASGTR